MKKFLLILLRWLSIIPMAIIVSLIFSAIIRIILYIVFVFSQFDPYTMMIRSAFLADCFGGYAFVIVGASAPKFKKVVLVVLFLIYLSLTLWLLYSSKSFLKDYINGVLVIAGNIGALIGLFMGFLEINKENK